MDSNVEEALRAKEDAEKLFGMRDFLGAKQFALKAQALCPQLEGISQMVATFEIYAATVTTMNREVDFYSVLGLDPSAEKSMLKKRYKKMAVLLHPDKNKTVGADEAFKLVSEAWAVLSDNVKRSLYDAKRNKQLSVAGYGTSSVSGSESSSRLDTFWTVCTSCRVQYEYLRKYVNKKLSCKNCRGVFTAVETGAAPVTYAPWSYTSENGYANHTYNAGTTYVQSSSMCFTGDGSSVIHPSQGYEYAGTVAFQWNTYPGSQMDPNGLPSKPANIRRAKANGKHQMRLNTGPGETPAPRMGRPPKKRKMENGETGVRTEPDSVVNNLNGGNEIPTRQYYSVAPAFDARKLLIDKARSVIRCKLKEMKLASTLKTEKAQKTLKKSSSMAITVPDPDFHDFDTDRSEEVFKPQQVWAIYDEEDGMPRLYCLVRQVISVKPFQLHISYLNSKPDTEFGINKSCGSFKVSHSDFVDQVNIFSHLLGREKAGKVVSINIYPKRGDIWAVYRNWSENWSKKTSKKVRRQYEMVEILDDYSEKHGVSVTPLVKLEGYKTVYQRNPNKSAVRLIPRKEMVRFSHQVPSCLLKGQALNLPDGCWDLDPAATPEQLLQADADEDEK